MVCPTRPSFRGSVVGAQNSSGIRGRGRSSAKSCSGRGSGRGDHRHQPAWVSGMLGGRPSPAFGFTEDEQSARSAPGRPTARPPRPASSPPPAGDAGIVAGRGGDSA